MLHPLLKNALSLMRQAHRRERGQVLVLVVLILSVVGGMSALAVDFGSYAAERRDLQNAADAIALAAAQDLPDSSAASASANSWQTKNRVGNATMTVVVTQQSLPTTQNPMVKVTLTRSHSFSFARLIGITSTNVSASATAIKTSPGGSGGLVPWSVTRPVLDSVPPGTTTTMKYDSNNAANGNFGAVRIDGSGASVYRDTAKYGSDGGLCASGVAGCPYPSTTNAETGNMVGATRTAVDYRMDNTDPACDTWSEVVAVSGGKQMLKPECNPFLAGGNPDSLRVVIIPVIASLCNGSCTVTITEFALFFLEGYGAGGCTGNHCDIIGRFINSNTNYGANAGIFNPDTLVHFVRLIE